MLTMTPLFGGFFPRAMKHPFPGAENLSPTPPPAREGLPDSSSPRAFATPGSAASPSWRELSPRVFVHGPGRTAPATHSPDALWLAQCKNPARPFVFGDGSHPTTRLCAGAVDQSCRLRAGRAVLDVGTGTGILARIARARGASFIAGTDVDPVAIESARENALLDASPVPIHFGTEPPDHWGRRFDLVVANILAEPLFDLAGALAAALVADGQLLLSGFTRAQAPVMRQRLEAEELVFSREAQLEGWTLLMFTAGALSSTTLQEDADDTSSR